MPFVRTKVIKGRTYRSLEERYREGNKVKSRYIRALPSGDFSSPGGADDGWLRRQFPRSYGLDWNEITRQELERQDREVARTTAHLEQLHADYGLKLGPSIPTPEDKPAPTIDLAAPAAAPQGVPTDTNAPEPEAATDAAPDGPDDAAET